MHLPVAGAFRWVNARLHAPPETEPSRVLGPSRWVDAGRATVLGCVP